MAYSESEIGQTNRQIIEAQEVKKARPAHEVLAELVGLVSSGPILLEEQKLLEELTNRIKTSKIKTEALIAELGASVRSEYPKRSGI